MNVTRFARLLCPVGSPGGSKEYCWRGAVLDLFEASENSFFRYQRVPPGNALATGCHSCRSFSSVTHRPTTQSSLLPERSCGNRKTVFGHRSWARSCHHACEALHTARWAEARVRMIGSRSELWGRRFETSATATTVRRHRERGISLFGMIRVPLVILTQLSSAHFRKIVAGGRACGRYSANWLRVSEDGGIWLYAALVLRFLPTPPNRVRPGFLENPNGGNSYVDGPLPARCFAAF
jgi:hypothetical protein